MSRGDPPAGPDAYKAADGTPVLQRSWIAYIDALGTKALMENLTNEQLQSHLDLVDRVVAEALGDQKVSYTILTFSDNIALALPHDKNELNIKHIMKSAGLYQYAMTVDGIFVRGGLSTGILHANQQSILGPALINAVVLEEQIAVYPRILLDDGATENVMRVLDYRDEYVCVDADGRVFVDYLRIKHQAEWDRICSNVWNEFRRLQLLAEAKAQTLTRHRDAVIRALESQHAKNARVREKYLWAAHYHNHCCRRDLEESLQITSPLSRFEWLHPREFKALKLPLRQPGATDMFTSM
jgi:hypothetical protein